MYKKLSHSTLYMSNSKPVGLPKNLLYENAINSAYARNYNNNISLQNGSGPYNLGETMIVNIPSARNLVMSGPDSVFKFDVVLTNGGAINPLIRLDKAGAHSYIKRVRIFHGSTILSDIDNYNNLAAILMTLQQSGNSTGKHSILSGIESDPNLASTGSKINTGNIAAGDISPKITYCIPLINFLSYSDKYIPLFALTGAPLRIEIQLVPNILQAVNSRVALHANDPLSVTNCEYICNFMEISDTGMNMINNSLGGMPLQWVVQDYKNYTHSATIAAGMELNVPIPSKFNSLRSLFFSFREKKNGEITFCPLGSCHHNLESYTVRLGSKTVPTLPPRTIPEFFSELVRAIGSISDINHEPNINTYSYDKAIPIANAEDGVSVSLTAISPSFYVGLDLESYSSSGMDNVYQGYNSSTDDIFFIPRFGATTGAATINIDTYAMFDQVITIQDGYAQVNF